jgi:hypothetical protein
MRSLLNRAAIGRSILESLAYADVFGWPMTEAELFSQIQSSKILPAGGQGKIQKQKVNFKTALNKLIKEKIIAKKDNFYFLYGRSGRVQRRQEHEKWVAEKMTIAHKAAKWLKLIPSILLVGVSGGLAVGNVTQDDDIDLFIICRRGTLWTTRLLAILLLELLGQRRRPGERNYKNKICLNMFIDEQGLAVPETERDVYTAHEIRNLKVLWERNGIYRRFLKMNQWHDILKSKIKEQRSKTNPNCKTFSLERVFAFRIIYFAFTKIEPFFRWLQLRYMRRRRTQEKIEPHRLLFHPEDKRAWVLKEYQKRLKTLSCGPLLA